MSRVYAIILAGGKGLRMGHDKPKQLLQLGDRPVIRWCLDTFHAMDEVAGIIIASPPEHIPEIEAIVSRPALPKVLRVIEGGATRRLSAWNALVSHPFADEDILLLHDAARPFIEPETIRACIGAAREHGAAGVYVPAIDTIASVRDGFVDAIPPRDTLYHTQTPQCFTYRVIIDAHRQTAADDANAATDDASLALRAGYRVRMIAGSYNNMKVTTPADFSFARFIAAGMAAGKE